MYKLPSLIKSYFTTDYILPNLISFQLVFILCDTYLKILFCYFLDIYCNELKFLYPNDLIFKILNSNKR